MLQRIQSVFLFLAAAVNLAVLFVPIWQFSAGTETEMVMGLSVLNEATAGEEATEVMFFAHEEPLEMAAHTAGVVLAGLVSLLALVNIFLFNNRSLQMKICNALMILVMLEIVAYVLVTLQTPEFATQAGDTGNPSVGFAIPIIAMVFVWLAKGRIKKDDDLVKSVDRIR
ncbi:DUF4293 domain-containing protein [Pontibacter sp. G13]|uniref:DUF4293 domain-containing protein n=1 Tax=Pontibacter sp. G13 TaxID=3074898 RepID=UPI002889C818|nr:DUF4293 domain-containing protein [Pontibacter sp. G13]WNJ16856.1 DUF4293 domain-containing protein [Pontibacter sp. G13]